MGFKLVTRKQWRAEPPEKVDDALSHPVPHVSISYIKGAKGMPDVETVQNLQCNDMFLGMSDIQANFLIAGNGYVYEGRGWTTRPGNYAEHVGKEGKFLEVCFIGEHLDAKDDHPLFTSLGKLLDMGMKKNYVSGATTFLGVKEDDMKSFAPQLERAKAEASRSGEEQLT